MRLVLFASCIYCWISPFSIKSYFFGSSNAEIGNPSPSKQQIASHKTTRYLHYHVGASYHRLKKRLSHLFTYYSSYVDFSEWWEQDDLMMEQGVKQKLINRLNSEISSMRDLDKFWEIIEGDLLENDLRLIKNDLKIIEGMVNAKSTEEGFTGAGSLNGTSGQFENVRNYSKVATLIYRSLHQGYTKYYANSFNEVHVKFLEAAIAYKRLIKIMDRFFY